MTTEKKTEVRKFRQVIDPKQIKYKMSHPFNKQKFLFDKKDGCYFPMDSKMDSAVDYFVKKKGFKLVIPKTPKLVAAK